MRADIHAGFHSGILWERWLKLLILSLALYFGLWFCRSAISYMSYLITSCTLDTEDTVRSTNYKRQQFRQIYRSSDVQIHLIPQWPIDSAFFFFFYNSPHESFLFIMMACYEF
jgi:hypothetical protein